MARFEATTAAAPGRATVSLTGECDLEGRDELTDLLVAAVESAPLVVVDLAALRFIDSSGVHALVTAHRAAKETGGRICVVNAAGAVADVLDVTGVGLLLSADDSVDESAVVPDADHG